MVTKYYKVWCPKTNALHPIGFYVLETKGEEIRFGWSFCHERDRFCKKKARLIAFNRMESGKYTLSKDGYVDELEQFENINKANQHSIDEIIATMEDAGYTYIQGQEPLVSFRNRILNDIENMLSFESSTIKVSKGILR
jgi:hypothetical protein